MKGGIEDAGPNLKLVCNGASYRHPDNVIKKRRPRENFVLLLCSPFPSSLQYIIINTIRIYKAFEMLGI
jgi:hypothetical protein